MMEMLEKADSLIIFMIILGLIGMSAAILVLIGCVGWLASQFYESKSAVSQSVATPQVIERLRGLKFEVEVEVDEGAGEIFSETTQYSDNFVAQTDEMARRFREHGNLVSVHNHPSEDVPPSIQDLAWAAKANFTLMIVVTPHFTYYLPRPENGWKSEAELTRAVNKYNELFICRMVGEEKFVGIDVSGALVTGTDMEIVSTDEALEAVCTELGYVLTKEEVKN